MSAANHHHRHHVLLVTFPAQGHINPSLQFAKRLSTLGVHVTFLTSFSAIRRITSSPPPRTAAAANIDFLSFSDGFDDGFSPTTDVPTFMSGLRNHGSAAVEAAIAAAAEKHGHPFSRVIYTLLVPWAGQVARRLHVPVTLLWIQPAALFAIYYYYFNSDRFDAFKNMTSSDGEHDIIVELPGLPPFAPADLPSFLLPTNPSVYDFALPTLEENFKILESPATVLVNTFDELEVDAVNAVYDDKYKLAAIGPLVPSAFLDRKDSSDTSFGGDLIRSDSSSEYVQWLDSKEKSSVIYVAFGSYSELARVQMEEIGKGLVKSGKPFLWVIRGSDKSEMMDEVFGSSSCREDLERLGKIVNWCNQLEVLSHPSVGCFFTHCGWNSTLESLVFGVPMVAFPQWTDQSTNSMLVEDYWRSGVRVDVRGGGVVGGDEIERWLEIVMGGGERGEEMRRQGEKWKRLAKEAMEENGSSNVNLKNFVDQL